MESCYLQENALGSTVRILDAQTGNGVLRVRYDAFGKAYYAHEGAPNSYNYYNAWMLRFLYTGREMLVSEHGIGSGLYDYRNRVYSTTLGRFLQPDPIGFDAGDVNWYRYVGNNAVNWRDPEGLKAQKTCQECKDEFSKCMDGADQVYNDTIAGIDAAIDAAWQNHNSAVASAVQATCGNIENTMARVACEAAVGSATPAVLLPVTLAAIAVIQTQKLTAVNVYVASMTSCFTDYQACLVCCKK
jgi:RHS repeat-associated protein